MITALGAILSSCNPDPQEASLKEETLFNYNVEQFADLRIMRYQVPGFEQLSLNQKQLIYHLSEAALCGRDILFDQNFKHNLCIRRTLETIVNNYQGDKTADEFQKLNTYLKRIWFSNGIHHHYSTEKFMPEFTPEFFARAIETCSGDFPLAEGETKAELIAKLTPILFDKEIAAKRVSQAQGADLVASSACNFYEGVNQQEVEAYLQTIIDPDDKTPVSYGLNSKLIKENGIVTEKTYRLNGMYSDAIAQIILHLEKATQFAENDEQKAWLNKLIEYYQTGSLETWDEYNVMWVKDLQSAVDVVNGFIENYGDPMGMKATWESVVNFRNEEASKRTKIISDNAQWFEDHSPIDSQYKKETVKGVSAKVITVAQLGGDCFPSSPLGINLPNADWIRKDHGSKSVTIENIAMAYEQASMGSGFMEEFAASPQEITRAKKYGALASSLHTDMHECLGHGSGKLAPGTSPDALKNYSSPLEEARADLFALYYLMDEKMVELGLVPDAEAAKAEYDTYIRNGLMTQLTRIQPGKDIEQAHMRDRQLIAKWCYEKGLEENVIEKFTKENKTYYKINDYQKLRTLFGSLLQKIQQIKSTGDFEAGKQLIETYAVKVDQQLHQEVLTRFATLNMAPYGGFINPVFEPVTENGAVTDIKVIYPNDYSEQMMKYSTKYSFLPTYN